MTIFYHYAMLNENDICFGFTKLAKKHKKEDTPPNLVLLPEENLSYIHTKYDRITRSFGQEKFEPDTDFELLERVDILEEDNQQLTNQVSSLESTLQNVNTTNETLIQSIAELTAMIAMLAPTE